MFTMGWTGEAAAASLMIDLLPARCGQQTTTTQKKIFFFTNRTKHPAAVLRLASQDEKDRNARRWPTWRAQSCSSTGRKTAECGEQRG